MSADKNSHKMWTEKYSKPSRHTNTGKYAASSLQGGEQDWSICALHIWRIGHFAKRFQL